MNELVEEVPNSSIKALLDWAKNCIENQADLTFQAPALEARLLFTHVTNKNQAWMMTHADDCIDSVLSKSEVKQFVELIEQRLKGKPIAFILGTQSFWSLNLKVSDCTLIPRQDTETLVETVLSLPLDNSVRALDLGTGTGAIALALAKEKPEWLVTGVDMIADAVVLAKENAELNNLRVNFLQSNWFNELNKNEGRFDLIVSNPPYVESGSEYLSQGDLRFEPLSALVSGDDGLDDIRLIINQSKDYLKDFAYLVIEHGENQHKNVQALLCEGGFTEVKSIEDLNHIPRITLGCWRNCAAS